MNEEQKERKSQRRRELRLEEKAAALTDESVALKIKDQKAKAAAQRRKWYVGHKDEVKATNNEYRDAHWDEFLEKERGRYQENKDLDPGLVKKERERLRFARRSISQKALGLCVSCDSPLVGNHGSLCERHWYAQVGTSVNDCSLSMGRRLKEILIRQDFKCIYTGVLLIPGINASLDHIQPKSKYPEGKCDLNNVQWVSTMVNIMKNNQTEEEFIALCKLVAEYRKEKP